MAAAGEILVRCLKMLAGKARAGVTTEELDAAAEKFIRSQGAEPAFKGYRGFPGLDLRLAQLDGRARHPRRLRAEARRRPLDRRRRGQGRLGRRRGDDGAGRPDRPRGAQAPRRDQGLAVRRGRADAARQPPRRRLGGDPARGRDRGPLDHPHPGRPRDRPRDARGPAGPQLRRARQGPRSSRRAWCWRSSRWSTPAARWCGWATTAGRSTPRTARWPPTSSSRSPSPPTGRGILTPGTKRTRARMAQELLDSAVDEYVSGLLAPHDDALDAACEPEAAGCRRSRFRRRRGSCCSCWRRRLGARTVLEFGTLGGYSTIWLGRALPAGGRLITLEADPEYAEVARGSIERAGLGDVVELRVGPALETLPLLEAEGAGPVRPHLHRRRQGQHAQLLRLGARALPPGQPDRRRQRGPRRPSPAASDDPPVQAQRRFHEMLAAEPRVTATTIQTVGGKGYDGFTIALVSADSELSFPSRRRRR